MKNSLQSGKTEFNRFGRLLVDALKVFNLGRRCTFTDLIFWLRWVDLYSFKCAVAPLAGLPHKTHRAGCQQPCIIWSLCSAQSLFLWLQLLLGCHLGYRLWGRKVQTGVCGYMHAWIAACVSRSAIVSVSLCVRPPPTVLSAPAQQLPPQAR